MRDLADVEITFVDRLDDLLDLRAWLGERRDWLSYDIETEGLTPGRHKIRLAQLGDEDRGWALPYRDYRGVVRELLESYDRPLVPHNLLFEQKMSKADGIHLRQELMHDSMVMCHLDNPLLAIGLKPAAARLVDRRAQAGQAQLGQAMKAGGWTWATVPVDLPQYWIYAVMDTILTARLAGYLWPRVQQFRNVYEVELGAIHVLRDAELTGVQLDLDYCKQAEEDRWRIIHEQRALIPEELKNPNADQQVLDFIRFHGGKPWKKTEKGNFACDDDVLKEFEQTIPACGPIRTYRKALWQITNYLKPFRELNVDGILHASVKPLGARTSRMSIEKPALQTLPRTPDIRDAIVAREGHTLILADFTGAELRVVAALANEENMCAAFLRGEDIHGWTAAETYQKPQESIVREERQVAKNAGFAVVYCAGVETFSHTAGIDPIHGAQFLERYHQLFPGIRPWQEEVMRGVIETSQDPSNPYGSGYGYVHTILGRRLPVEKRKAYVGPNYIVQPSATSDVLKLKLIELSNAGLHDMIRLPVHDEIIFEAEDSLVPEVCQVINEVMPERHLFRIPLEIELTTTKRWGDKYRGN